ncbi:MAG: winged helix-turn-helix transcriptional regulator, partial [Candidatus Bathyarchaeota archaeon]|nr:winged helix-turn-helix transcriptional regulator [Candidatus Bathyarchaeota archaeon]
MIDEMDEKILKEYLVDSRRSFREIARILKISPGTVVSRIRDLEEKGIITKYTAQIDYEKLGYELTVISEITVSMGMTEEVGREVTRIKGT